MSIEGRFHVVRDGFTLDVDLSLPSRGVSALFGRSGSGKTTVLRCIAGLERLSGVRLTVDGTIWQDETTFLPVHRRPIGYVFQEASLFPHLKVERNLCYGQRRVATDERVVDFDETVALLGLDELLGRYPDALSGGQRQRVAIGRALLSSPRLLLMDEPLSALDTATKAEILPWLERLHETLSIPVVYVSHAIDEVARLADHMVLLEEGRALAQGPLAEVLTRTDLPLAHGDSASAVLETTVVAHDPAHRFVELSCEGRTIRVAAGERPPGQRHRLRVAARDVAIALQPPVDSSVCNSLAVTIAAISDDPHPGHVLVRLQLGEQMLLARISRHSCERLALAPGMAVQALVKAVSLG